MFGSTVRVAPEKAVLACSSAVREWDSNGTNFGYNPERGATAGEFGHNDFYPGRGRGRAAGRLRWAADARGDGDARRNSRPAGRGVRAQESQDRSCGARGDRVGGRLRRGAGGERRPDRIGDRAGGGALHSVSRDSARASAFGFERRVGGDQRRSGRAEHAAGDARLRRPGRHLSQSAGDLLLVRASRTRTRRARSIWRWPRRATTSP